jgi:two-component system, sensor histidine kinase and response regulator
MSCPPSPDADVPLDVFNRAKLLEKFDNDEEFFEELLDCYLEDVPKHLKGIQQSLEGQNYEEAERWAHTTKGSSANMEAEEMRRLAFDLETILKDRQLESSQLGFNRLVDAFQRFLVAVGRAH